MAEAEERGWIGTVAVVWLAVFVALIGMSLVIPFLPLYLEELRVPPGQRSLWAGWITGANFLCAAVMAPVWGSLADRFGRKPMALRALAGLAVSVALMGSVRSAPELLALRMLQGSLGGFVAAAIALVGTAVPRERVGSSLGILQTAVVGGNLLGPVFGGELSHAFGYRATFRITGAALVCALLLILLLVRERPPEAREKRSGVREHVRELLAVPELRWMLAVVACGHSGLMLLNPQLSLFAKELTPEPEQVNRIAGWVMAAPAVSGFLTAPLWGRWGDRRDHAGVLAGALLVAAALAPWGGRASVWPHLLALRFAMGAFTSALNPSAHSAAAQSVDEARTAGAFALLSSAQMLGSCVGPFLSGPLATAFGVRALFPITGALLLLGALAALRVRWLRGRRRKLAPGPAG